VSVRVTALEVDLITTSLFGTAAKSSGESDQPNGGPLAAADGGTLFLDELLNMPLLAQAELLRAIDRYEVIPVGGTTTRPVSVRLIAATTSNPTEAVRDGLLRRDLFERLAVYPIAIPPLRDRIEDMPALAKHFLRMFGIKNPDVMVPEIPSPSSNLVPGWKTCENLGMLSSTLLSMRATTDRTNTAHTSVSRIWCWRLAARSGFLPFRRWLIIHRRQQRPHRGAERLGDLLGHQDRRHSHAAFEHGNVRPVKAGSRRECFLRNARCFTSSANHNTEELR